MRDSEKVEIAFREGAERVTYYGSTIEKHLDTGRFRVGFEVFDTVAQACARILTKPNRGKK